MRENRLYKEYDQCPICGDPLKKNAKGLVCNCCGFVAPNEEISSMDQARLNQAYDALRSYRFDQAEEAYSLILEDNRNSSSLIHVAALWGKLLANFGVVYIRDMNGTSIPTFSEYDPDFKSITESEEYKAIVKSGVSNEAKKSYLDKAKALDEIYKRIDKELNSKKEYDVFICTKISRKTPKHPEYDGYTEDSRIADDFYYALRDGGLNVFYSDKCCQGIDYDSQILSALLKSKKILIIATEKEYIESPWVQSEWRRWLNFIECGKKEKNSIFLFLPHYEKENFDMPRALKKVQRYTRQFQVTKLLTEESEKALLAKKEKEEKERLEKEAKEKAEQLEKERKEQLEKARQERLAQEKREKENKAKAKQKKKEEKNKVKAQKKQEKQEQKTVRREAFSDYMYCHYKGWLYFIGTIPVVVCAVLSCFHIFSNLNNYTTEVLEKTKMYFFIGLGVFVVGLVLLLVGFLNAYEENGDSDGDQVSLICNGILNTIAAIGGIVVMCAVFIGGQLSINSYYIDDDCGVVYAEYNNGYKVVGLTQGYSDIVIEGKIGNLIVTEIKDYVFKWNTDIKTLTFDNGNLTIKEKAFENCYNIETITFVGNGTYNIGKEAFKGCTSLKEFNVGQATIITDYKSGSTYTYKGDSNIFGGSTNATVIIDGGKIQYMVDSVAKYIISYGSEVITSMYDHEDGNYAYVDNSVVVFVEGSQEMSFKDTKFYVGIIPAALWEGFSYYPIGYTIYLPEDVTSIPDNFFGDKMHLDKLTIYYEGSEDDWEEIEISSNGNSNLDNATIIYETSYDQ